MLTSFHLGKNLCLAHTAQNILSLRCNRKIIHYIRIPETSPSMQTVLFFYYFSVYSKYCITLQTGNNSAEQCFFFFFFFSRFFSFYFASVSLILLWYIFSSCFSAHATALSCAEFFYHHASQILLRCSSQHTQFYNTSQFSCIH